MMRLVRPFVAQCFRGGKSIGCRRFSSPSSPKDGVDDAMEIGNDMLALLIINDIFRHCVGFSIGIGIGALTVGNTNTKTAEAYEQIWIMRQRLLEDRKNQILNLN